MHFLNMKHDILWITPSGISSMPFPRVPILSPGHPHPIQGRIWHSFPPATATLSPTNTSSCSISPLPLSPPTQGRNSVSPHSTALHLTSLVWPQQLFYSPHNSLLLHNSPILLPATDFNFIISKLLCCVPTLVSQRWRRDSCDPKPFISRALCHSPFTQSSPWLTLSCLWIHHLDLSSLRNIFPQCSQISSSDTGTPAVHIQQLSASP